MDLKNKNNMTRNEILNKICMEKYNMYFNQLPGLPGRASVLQDALDAVINENCNLQNVINWAYFPKEKPNYGDEIIVEYPPEQMTKKEVLIYGRYTDLIDGCKWALITPCL